MNASTSPRTEKRRLIGKLVAMVRWIVARETPPRNIPVPGQIKLSPIRWLVSRETLPVVEREAARGNGTLAWLVASDHLSDRPRSAAVRTGVIDWLTGRENLPVASIASPIASQSFLRWLLAPGAHGVPRAEQHPKEVSAHEP